MDHGYVPNIVKYSGNHNAPTDPKEAWRFGYDKPFLGVKAHYKNPFGKFATPKMRWIVLKNVDIQSVGAFTIPWSHAIASSCGIGSAPNPDNAGKMGYFVWTTAAPETLVTIRHNLFAVTFQQNVERDFFDLLEENCNPISSEERLHLIGLLTHSLACPIFCQCKRFLVPYFQT